jgi:hypothetical protein
LLKPVQRMIKMATQRPNCTHVIMDVSYAFGRCDLCNEFPALGWLYKCRQDEVQDDLIGAQRRRRSGSPEDSDLVSELKHLGFSPSVIKQAEANEYTSAQLEILKQQKSKVNALVAQTLGCDISQSADENLEPEASLHPNITLRKPKLSNTKRFDRLRLPKSYKCNLKCCHVSYSILAPVYRR